MRRHAFHVVGVVVLLAIGWFAHQLLGVRVQAPEARDEALPTVRVETTAEYELNPQTEYVGHVEPVQETDILPQIEGYVLKICFEEGASVKQGDVLFEIDPEQYEASLTLRKSEVTSALARQRVAEAEVDRAKRYYTRLTAVDDRGITATERDAGETALASASAALNVAEANVAQAQAALAIAEFNFKHTKVRSPISGRIGRALRHVGDYVSPSKTPLAHVVQLDPIRVVFPMTDRDYDGWLAAAASEGTVLGAGRRLRVRLANGAFYETAGRMDFADNQMDRHSASVTVRAAFDNPSGRLVPGAFVKIVADSARAAKPVAVPTTALVLDDAGWSVWVLGEGDVAVRRPIERGPEWDGRTAVVKGLAVGERIVTEGIHKVVEGQPVKIVDPGTK